MQSAVLFTHVFDDVLLHILDGSFLQGSLHGAKVYNTAQTQRVFLFAVMTLRNLSAHRVVDEVHGASNVLEHASVGHKQVAVLVTPKEAGGDGTERLERSLVYIKIYIISKCLCRHESQDRKHPAPFKEKWD